MTRFRCDEMCNDSFIANFQEIVQLKNFEYRSVFDEVMPKILLVPFFSGHDVISLSFIYSGVVAVFLSVGLRHLSSNSTKTICE